jgi:hypothetical protein
MERVGEVRLALKVAAASQPGCVRELAERAQVGYAVAQRTVENMVRAGELVSIGTKDVPWRRAAVNIYAHTGEPRRPGPRVPIAARSPDAELQRDLMRLWY